MGDADEVIVLRTPQKLTLEEYLDQLAEWMGEEPPPSPLRSRIRDAAPEEELIGVIILGGIRKPQARR